MREGEGPDAAPELAIVLVFLSLRRKGKKRRRMW